jgi:general secretion pathway protein C
MRLRSHPRAERLFRRLPRFTALSALELLLLALIAVQAARLVWTLVTPAGPVGAWRAPGALATPGGDAILADFDPFFRLSAGGGPGVVSSLDLKLYGVREDRATGRGSAIIALPDGSQRSFAVGDEIMPGVRLAAVGFDHVTIDRSGVAEQIFLDQSRPVSTIAPADAGQTAYTPPPDSQIRIQPRMGRGGVNGLTVSPGSDGGYALQAVGLMPGDVIVSINGERITSFEQARGIVRRARGELPIIVDRRGREVSIRASLEL